MCPDSFTYVFILPSCLHCCIYWVIRSHRYHQWIYYIYWCIFFLSRLTSLFMNKITKFVRSVSKLKVNKHRRGVGGINKAHVFQYTDLFCVFWVCRDLLCFLPHSPTRPGVLFAFWITEMTGKWTVTTLDVQIAHRDNETVLSGERRNISQDHSQDN